jgi:DNA-binding XRE family transcriptional regulator
MPNFASLLKVEILRLSRRAVRQEIETTARMSAQHRRSIAALRREVSSLRRDVARLQRRLRSGTAARDETSGGTRLRFVAKGLRSQRARLGLSAAECGKLLGVSAQSVYNWERKVSTPGAEQLRRIARFRTLGKREAHAELAALA